MDQDVKKSRIEAKPTPETGDGSVTQSNRDRIRVKLFDRLGFRFPRGTDPEVAKSTLNRIADELAYLSDDSLAAVCDILRTKGEGSSRNFWPDRATFLGFAEIVQRRPLRDLPGLASWFGSIEGPKAEKEGTLVETMQFIISRKMPPVSDTARQAVVSRAAENKRRLQIISERRERGVAVDADDLAFEDWYGKQLAVATDLMREERARRGFADHATSSSGGAI
jgi:hypothetical protein